MQTRKIGTITLGITLLSAGIVFLINSLKTGVIPYETILDFWPAILVMLGLEILVWYCTAPKTKTEYDGAGIFILILMSVFALFMGTIQTMLHYHMHFNAFL